MKKILTLLTILIATTLFLSACGDDTEPTEDKTPTESEVSTGEEAATEDPVEDTEEGTDSKEEDELNKEEEDSSASENDLNIDAEDQLDLRIGDTGKFDTTIGQFEITLDGAKLITDELDGEVSQLDDLLLLDITVKNTSGDTMLLEEILESTVVTEDLEKTGSANAAEYFDSVEELTGEITNGEEISGQFIADVYESEEYYLIQETGAIAAGTTNQVMWTIPVSEAQ